MNGKCCWRWSYQVLQSAGGSSCWGRGAHLLESWGGRCCAGAHKRSSLAWVAWQSRRLSRGRMLPAKHRTSVGRRLIADARMILPDWNEVWVWSVWVCTGTYCVHTSMYWTNQSFPENKWADFSLTFCNGKWYWAFAPFGTSILWYLNIIIVPPSPDIVRVQLVYTGMYWVCTCTYWYVLCSLKYF